MHQNSFFAVFDGHGRAAHRVSAFVAQTLARQFSIALAATTHHHHDLAIEIALRKACARTAKLLTANQAMDVHMTGTTASVAVVHGRKLVCANVGDSRIVLGTMRHALLTPLVLTTDHVPTEPAERQRIEAAGGRVECWSPAGCDTGPPRVWLKDRRIPGLSMSRAFGDSVLDGIVTADPQITAHALSEHDRFAVIATDGVWAVMTNEDVIEFVGDRLSMSCQTVAEELVKHAATLWFESGGESIDDISLILVGLNW